MYEQNIQGGMKALVSDEFYHIMECISDKDYDADHVLTTMKQFIPAFAERYGTNYMEFANKVEAVFRKYQVDPSYFEIEITESYDSEDMEALVQFEKRMHEIGVKLSVDDFGSGFSSLKMVKNIVSDTIKLDKSIIDGVGSDDKNNEIIVSHIIKMIRCLGKEVLAEGVETKEQAAFLRDNGCDLIQGYLYGKPIPREEFEENWLKKNSLRDV